MTRRPSTSECVREVPGIYGAVRIEESVIQRIWKEQAFSNLTCRTVCGKKLEILHPGVWNLAEEGPDFRGARLRMDGKERSGDVEVHFYPADWNRHSHQKDSNYERVVLQVCVFQDSSPNSLPALTQKGNPVPCLVLLPLLFYGIEEYAEEYAMSFLAGVDGSEEKDMAAFGAISPEVIKERAGRRWSAKLGYARTRLRAQGWETALHQWFLEILGYRRNKTPMARIARRYPPEHWKKGKVDATGIHLSENDWRLRGCRPANHPRERIRQYAELWQKNPTWIDQWARFKEVDSLGVSKFARIWRDDLLGGVFARGKALTLWVDAAWPLWCAHHGVEGLSVWMDWPAGDCPRKYREFARVMDGNDSGCRFFSNGQVQCILETLSMNVFNDPAFKK